MMKNNKGFITISFIYSFFLVFIFLILAILANSAYNKRIFKVINTDIKKKFDSSTENLNYEDITLNCKVKDSTSSYYVTFIYKNNNFILHRYHNNDTNYTKECYCNEDNYLTNTQTIKITNSVDYSAECCTTTISEFKGFIDYYDAICKG